MLKAHQQFGFFNEDDMDVKEAEEDASIIKRPHHCKSEKHGKMFEAQLRRRWKEKTGRKRQRHAGDGEEDAPRAPNHLKHFLASKGIVD